MQQRRDMKKTVRDFSAVVAGNIRVFAPATVANIACGYDVLGFAVDQPSDEVVVKKTARAGLRIKKITGDGEKLPLNPEQNTVTAPVFRYLEQVQYSGGFEFELTKNVPFAGGMGSSSASSVAGVFAVNELLGRPLKVGDLLPFAMEGERVACGVAHADNVAPALLGGFVIIRSYDPLDVIQIDYPRQLHCTLIHPEVAIRTADSRKVLPTKVYLKDAVKQWGNVAGLVAGLMKGDFDLIGRSLEDHLIEPVRSMLIPGFHKARNAALQEGVLGCSISGSGPSMFALSKSRKTAERCAEAMQATFDELGIESQTHVSRINKKGPQVIG